ncbi:MAG: SPFH domain-containing protein [Minisyncoccia bacterium]
MANDGLLVRINFWSVVATTTAISGMLWSWIGTLLILFLGVMAVYGFVVLLMVLAKKNILFTIVEEGQAKGITIFGRANRCLLSYTSHRFNGEIDWETHRRSDEFWEITRLGKDDDRPEEKRLWFRFIHHTLGIDLGGLRWIGIWPFYKIHRYDFRWTSLRGQLPTGYTAGATNYEQTRVQNIDYILVQQATYLLDLTGIEDQDQLSIKIKLVWTTQVVNPFKALFRVRNWLETSADRLLTHIRRNFAANTWKVFQSQENINVMLQPIADELERLYGVKTIGVEVIELIPPEEFRGAAEKIRMAQADATAAEHEAKAAKLRGGGEAERIKSVMAAAADLGDNGVAMKIAEDLAKGGKAVVVMGAARDLVADILGKAKREE